KDKDGLALVTPAEPIRWHTEVLQIIAKTPRELPRSSTPWTRLCSFGRRTPRSPWEGSTRSRSRAAQPASRILWEGEIRGRRVRARRDSCGTGVVAQARRDNVCASQRRYEHASKESRSSHRLRAGRAAIRPDGDSADDHRGHPGHGHR